MTVNAMISETGNFGTRNSLNWQLADTLFVHNPNVNAITRALNCGNCGFVSSLDNGNLVRRTASPGAYLSSPLGLAKQVVQPLSTGLIIITQNESGGFVFS